MRVLVRVSIVLAFLVVILGAYTRLTDAGLGCPDWPGCYGHLTVPSEHNLEQAQSRFPLQPIEPQKAWNEMIHRYFAGCLGLLILLMAIVSFRKRLTKTIKYFSLSLLLLVCFQAVLGMWTVTLSLMPIVVMAHLLGGFSIFILLILLERQLTYGQSLKVKLPKFAWCCGVILILQIALGGWTSSNYAALACTQLPICEAGWMERLSLDAFHLVSPKAESYQYGVLDYSARMTIHIVHRLWAIVTFFALLSWILYCFYQIKTTAIKTDNVHNLAAKAVLKASLLLLLLLVVQVGLGIANVVLSLPLYIAVMHNGVALLLLTSFTLSLYYFLRYLLFTQTIIK